MVMIRTKLLQIQPEQKADIRSDLGVFLLPLWLLIETPPLTVLHFSSKFSSQVEGRSSLQELIHSRYDECKCTFDMQPDLGREGRGERYEVREGWGFRTTALTTPSFGYHSPLVDVGKATENSK